MVTGSLGVIVCNVLQRSFTDLSEVLRAELIHSILIHDLINRAAR